MTTPGSIAAAHLDFMLRCQSGNASLPEFGELQSDLAAPATRQSRCGSWCRTEPFVGIRARRRF